MTQAQKRLRALRERQSKERQRMAELAGAGEWTDESRAEYDGLESGVPDLERELREAQRAVEAEEESQRVDTRALPSDPETRARIELRQRASLGRYLGAALAGRLPQGAEAELCEAAGVTVGMIPVEMFDVPAKRQAEHRVDAPTTAPTTGTGVNLDPIYPAIYARSVLPRLGVAMPRVGSGTYATMTITAGLSAGAEAAGDARESTAATLTPKTTTPHRVSARLSLRIEDIASIGAGNFESMLRQNLMLALSDELDRLGLNGDPSTTAAEPQGLLSQLTDSTAPTSVIDFDGYARLAADGIDGGPWAEGMGDVRLLVNAETMRHAETKFQESGSYKGELSAAAYLRDKAGAFVSSRRMPATASTIAPTLRARMATMGLEGVDAIRLATCPVWAEIGIDDIYSDSASGTRHVTLHSLIGDVLIQQADAYERVDIKLAT